MPKQLQCEHCNKNFNRSDEIIKTTVHGGIAYVHNECHYEWLLRWDNVDYFTYDELLEELEDCDEY